MTSSPITTFAHQESASRGFTLVEVLMAVVLVALLAVSIGGVYSSGHQSMAYQAEQMLLDSRLRSRMEFLVSTDFESLSSGSENVSINGTDYTIAWTVENVDLNSDGLTEPSARKVTVSISGLAGRSLTTVIVDNEDMIGKIS